MGEGKARLGGKRKDPWRRKDEIALDRAKERRNTRAVSRWAMSPVFRSFPSPTTSGFTARRRARTSSAFLFPVSPERSPNQRTEELAPLSAPGSGVLDFSRSVFAATNPETREADCPPLAPDGSGEICRGLPDFQKAAVDTPEAAPAPTCDEQASAPLVGIARLASISPMAPTRRRSEERPEYFFLPV